MTTESQKVMKKRPFMQRLIAGTLQSLRDRVLPSGFCHTSFGELNGVRCYGDSHYPRDAAEAARALALHGDVKRALRILAFHFKATPKGQRYIPHTIAPNGALIHNTIQTDTLAHSVLALRECFKATDSERHSAESDEMHALYEQCKRFAQWLWEDHFHDEFSLLDAGNYNEQGYDGVRDTLLDLFANASCHAMYNALAEIASRTGDSSASERVFRERAERLATGIEAHLYDGERGIYRPAIRLKECPAANDMPINWGSFYPLRWYCPRMEPYQRVFDLFWETTCNDWGDGLLIPSCEAPSAQFRTMGKVVAVMLSFAAKTNDTTRLNKLLDFIEKTVRKPDDLWPEYWYHHSAPDSEYMRWFFQTYTAWTPFTVDPQGDYTVDSGNCEQSAVFITEMHTICNERAVL